MEHSSFVTRFAQALVKNKVMKEPEAESFIQEFHDRAKGNVVSFLLEEGIVEREDILKALASVFDVPSYDVRGHFFNHEILLLFPQEFLEEHSLIPLEIDEDIMTIVMSNPEDEEALEELGNYVNYSITVYVGIQEHIKDAIEEYYDTDLITAEIEEQEEDNNDEEDDSDIVDYM